MGIRLIGSALMPDWSGLSDRAFRVLIHMAYTAKDTATNGHAAATHWAGHEALIIAVLGLDPDQLSDAEREAADKKIQRAIRELKAAGALEVISSGSRGRVPVYRLHVHPWEDTKPVDNSRADTLPLEERWTPSDPLSGHQVSTFSPERWTNPVPKGGHPVSPRGEQLGEQERRGAIQDPTQPPAQLSRPAR